MAILALLARAFPLMYAVALLRRKRLLSELESMVVSLLFELQLLRPMLDFIGLVLNELRNQGLLFCVRLGRIGRHHLTR